MELGIKDEEKKLYKQADDVAENVLENLENERDFKKSTKTYHSQNARYNFTMNIYCQKLDENELDKIFNYMNKRFGIEY